MIRKNDLYFDKFMFFTDFRSKNTLKPKKMPVCHWVCQSDAKIFSSVAEANAIIKVYKLKNISIEKIKKGK